MKRGSTSREVGIALLVYGLYLLVRGLVLRSGGRDRGRRNAERIRSLEERAGVAVEPALQRLALRLPRLVHGLNVGYPVFNVGLTVGWLLVLHRRRDPGYPRLRRACVAAHVCAQPVFLVAPVAPPRTLPGYVDTLAVVSGLDLEHPLLVRFYNPVAAMPSLHAAFAVVTAAALAERAPPRLVAAGASAYPLLVTAVVVATGNHFVLDAAAGAVLGGIAWRLA